MAKEIMDVKEVAEYLGFSETKIYRLIATSAIPFAKVGGQYRFTKSLIDEWLTAQTKTERPARDELEKVRQQADPLTKRLLFVGLLTRKLEPEGIRPIIVGGQAVEFYTAGGYATKDIDLVSPGYEEIDRILEAWGFKKEGRHWFNEQLDISVEVPESVLAGDENRLTVVEIDDLRVYVIGIEDIIVDRLNAFVHWKSSDDRIWAKEMMLLGKEDIDWGYLKKRAAEEDILAAAEELEGEISKNAGG